MRTPGRRMNRRWLWFWITLLLAVVAAFRLGFFAFALQHTPLSSDEAWPSLMAMHILKGEFPVVYWGQTYMGTQESFLDAGLIAMFGATTLTIRLYPLLLSFLFVAVTYGLAARVFDRATALVSVVLLAIPVPYLTMCGVIVAPDNYLAVTTLGSLALLMTHDLVYRPPDRWTLWRFTGLGFLLGFTFWLHILIVSIIGVCVLWLLLSDKLWFLRRSFWLFSAAFAIGALPLIVYNLRTHMATFNDVGQTTSLSTSWALFKTTFHDTLPFLIGTRVMLYPDNPHFVGLPGALAIAAGTIWAVAVAIVLLRHTGAHLRLALLSVRGATAVPLLTAAGAAAIFVFCRSTRSGWDNARYLLPVISVLPILLAGGLSAIRRWCPPIFWIMLATLLSAQVLGNALLAREWAKPDVMATDLDLPDTRGLKQFLSNHGISRAYAHYWLSYRLTYETQERLLVAEPYNERFAGKPVKFLAEVAASTNVAFIQHPKLRFAHDFDAMLRADGGSYSKATVDVFTVYYDFHPPATAIAAGTSGPPRPMRELPRTEWRLASSHGQEDLALMLDGKTRTRWATHKPQTPGMWFQVDLVRTQEVGQIDMHMGSWASDFPRGYVVKVSDDSSNWRTVLRNEDIGGCIYWQAGHPNIYSGGELLTAGFPARAARYVRVELIGAHPVLDWSIAELRIFGPSP